MLTTEWDFEKEKQIYGEEEREKGKQEGIEIGEQRGRKEGKIEERIIICKELGLSYTDTFKKVIEKYYLSEIEAKEMMDKYWE